MSNSPFRPGTGQPIDRLADVEVRVPMMLDESVAASRRRRADLRLRRRGLAHLKLVKLGGIAPTVAAASQLAAVGVPFMIGQMNEGGAATAAALHVACATSPAFAELYGADGLIDDPASGISIR